MGVAVEKSCGAFARNIDLGVAQDFLALEKPEENSIRSIQNGIAQENRGVFSKFTLPGCVYTKIWNEYDYRLSFTRKLQSIYARE